MLYKNAMEDKNTMQLVHTGPHISLRSIKRGLIKVYSPRVKPLILTYNNWDWSHIANRGEIYFTTKLCKK